MPLSQKHLEARLAALAAGKHVFEGTPCKAAGHTLRYTATGECKICKYAKAVRGREPELAEADRVRKREAAKEARDNRRLAELRQKREAEKAAAQKSAFANELSADEENALRIKANAEYLRRWKRRKN